MDFSKSLISLPFYLLWPPIIALKMWLINAKGFAKVKRAKPVLSNEMIVPLWFYAFLFGCFWNFITPRQCLLKNVFANLPLWEYPGSLPIFSFSILPIPFSLRISFLQNPSHKHHFIWNCPTWRTEWCSSYRELTIFRKIVMHLPCEPPLSVKKHKKNRIKLFIGTLFFITNEWKYSKYPLIGDLLNHL